MHILKAAAALLLLTATAARAQVADSKTDCRAHREGETLLTTAIYSDGYKVEGPWRIDRRQSGRTTRSLTATLYFIIETDSQTQQPQLMSLPGAIQLTFKGRTEADLLQDAARIWCTTVTQARAAQARPSSQHAGVPGRIIMLE